MVDMVGCSDVAGRGRYWGRGGVRPKSGRDNRIWVKGTSHSVRRGRSGSGGAGREDAWSR